MASLPPYSTYRTDNKQMMYPQAISHGNILTFTPPGFKQTLNVKFPDCRLAVCEKCKKNYKTRDMCRVRNSHTAAPWTTAFICITLDDTCTDEDGKFIDKPFTVRMVQWQPFCVKEPFDAKTPVCSACKKTNRTRSFCRERHKHRQLPWCTVYVLLSALDSADPATLVAAPSKPAENGGKAEESTEGKKPDSPEEQKSADPEEKKSDSSEEKKSAKESDSAAKDDDAKDGDAKEPGTDEKSPEDTTEARKSPSDESKAKGEAVGGDGDDIDDIAESRTFLAKVSCRANTIHWLELAEFDSSDAGAVQGLVIPESHMQPLNTMGSGQAVPAQTVDPQQAQYYAQAMGYAAANHQQALKSHQQYFFQMQQRQHQYAAQAAWQAQYNQSGGEADGQAQAPPVQPIVANGQPAEATTVTAGEAAAQQQKQGHSDQTLAVSQQPPQPQPGQAQTAGAAAAAATAAQQQQQQGNPQWQMMYHQHLYQQQMQPPQQAQPGQMQPQAQPPQQQMQLPYSPQPAGVPHGAAPLDGSTHEGINGEENDAKRTRYV